MSETLKATIVGTIIIGIFMLLGVKMVTNTMWDISRSAKHYVERQKTELKAIVKTEKHKAADVIMKAADQISADDIKKK